MPIYEYECTRCGDEFEALQSFSDKPLKTCKKCKGRLRKKVSQSAFHLKGSGWYVTDYAGSAKPGTKPGKPGDNNGNGNGTGHSGSEAPSKPKQESSAESKSDSKPASSAPESKQSDSSKASSSSHASA